MSVLQAISTIRYTMMANNAMNSMINSNQSRLNLITGMSYNPSFGSLESISAMDTQYEMDAITFGIQYKMAKAMLENLKKLKSKNSTGLNVLG